MPPGFLAVFAEPGAKCTVEEFQDWYGNEHVPLRLNHLPSFLTGARYSASDSKTPSWAAFYDIDDIKTFQDDSYMRLRKNRSTREASVVQRLEKLDRRACQFIVDENLGLTTSFHPNDPTKFLLTNGTNDFEGAEGAEKWLKITGPKLKIVEGWTRTRVYHSFDNLTVSVNGAVDQSVPAWLVIHEFLHPAAADSQAFKDAIAADGVTFKEERRWGLYRAYPSIAQK